MKRAVPPLIWNNTKITVARAQNVLSNKMAVFSIPVRPDDVVNKKYLETNVTANTFPSSILYSSDPSGSIKGTSKFVFDDTVDTVYLDGELRLSGGKITGLGTPINPSDAVNKAYVDSHSGSGSATGPSLSVQYNSNGLFAGSSLFTFNETLGSLSVGSIQIVGGGTGGGTNYSITGLSYPVNSTDAANKAYVDSATGSAPGLPIDSIQFNSGGVFTGSENLRFSNDTLFIGTSLSSVNTSTGSLVVSGGAGISGDVFIGGTCNADEYLTTSDQRLKTNVNKIANEDVSKLMKLSGYTYYLKDHPELKYGVMAQEIENAGLEHFVKNVGDHKKVHYQYFIPILIESVKVLKEKLTETEKKYELLSEKLNNLV